MKNRSAFSRSILGLLSVASFLGFSAGAFADPVIDWNIAMTSYSESQPPPGIGPLFESRNYAIAHIAMLNAITGDDAAAQPFNKVAAVAQAAHDVLVNLFPGGADQFDALLASQLAAIPDGAAKTRGIYLGATAAARKLAVRANDGSATAQGPYTPGTQPGDYRFTPPFDFALATKWGQVRPFVLKSGHQFRAPAPYTVRDLQYTFDFNEIKALGSKDSVARTPDQTNLAIFWYESAPNGWNRISRTLVAKQSNTLLEHARLFAALNASLADAYIASLDSKYTYNFWRPITAIQLAGHDGNRLTTPDLDWQPLLLTPPVPDYPSAHAAAGGAASSVLIWFFGGDKHTFTLASTFPVPPRTFYRISDAAKENSISRMFVGIHFRLACTVGYEQGLQVGDWAVQQVTQQLVGWEK
jgi:PAP2 superfamily